MRLYRPGPRTPPLGLDIAETSLALLECSAGPPLQPRRYVLATLPAAPADDEQGLSDAIRQAWRQLGSAETRVAIALSASCVDYRILSLPVMPRHECEAMLRAETVEWLSLPEDAISMDYQLLPPTQEAPDPDLQPVLVCAAPLADVSTRIRAVQRAGLKAVHLGVDSFALLTACAHMQLWQNHRKERKVILHAGTLSLTGYFFLAQALLPDRPERHFTVNTGADLAEIRDALAAFAPHIVCLAGTGDQAHRLHHDLKPLLSCPVIVASPFPENPASTDPSDDYQRFKDAPALALAFGLALNAAP